VVSQCIVTSDDQTWLIVLVLINPLESVRIKKGRSCGAHLEAFLGRGKTV
jgi:hypothetical protein